MSESVAVVLAAGSGERLGGGKPKAFIEISPGTTILAMAVKNAAECPRVTSLVVTVPAGYEDRAGDLEAEGKQVLVIPGGDTRQESVQAGLDSISRDVANVICHDAARPFASPELFSKVLAALDDDRVDGAVPVIGVVDTVKRMSAGSNEVAETIAREQIGLAQTPQAFKAEPLRVAHSKAEAEGLTFTDDAAMLEWAGFRVVTVPGDEDNFKVTTAADLARAEVMAGG